MILLLRYYVIPFCYNHHIQISCIVNKHHAQPNFSAYLKVNIILYGRDLSGDSFRKLEEVNKSEKRRRKASEKDRRKAQNTVSCLSAKKLTKKLRLQNFRIFFCLGYMYIVVLIKIRKSKQCRPRWGDSLWAASSESV